MKRKGLEGNTSNWWKCLHLEKNKDFFLLGGRKGMDQGQRLAGLMSYLFLLLSANLARWKFPDSLAVKYGHVTKFWPKESGQRMPFTFLMGSPPCPFLPLQSGSYVSRWQSHREKELSSCISAWETAASRSGTLDWTSWKQEINFC